MKSLLTILCLLLGSTFMFGQSDHVKICGTVKTEGVTPADQKSKTLVTIFYKDEVVEQFFTNENGSFTYVLNKGNEYQVVFSKSGYFEKQFVYDLKKVPETEEELALNSNVTLMVNNFNKAMEELSYTPAAKCAFNQSASEIMWDKRYSQQINEMYYTLAME